MIKRKKDEEREREMLFIAMKIFLLLISSRFVSPVNHKINKYHENHEIKILKKSSSCHQIDLSNVFFHF